ncbi:CPBP family intramembrane glutamic endopeptidase [Flavitalea antarctica]
MEKRLAHSGDATTISSFLKDPKVSAILRSVLFWMMFMSLLFLGGSFLVPLFNKSVSQLIFGIVGTTAAVITVYVFLRREKQTFRQIGLVLEPASITRFLSGYVIGTVICVIMISVLIMFSELELKTNNAFVFTPITAIGYLAIVPLALMEELAFRSYPFIRLNERLNFRMIQLVVALAFAAYHMIGGQDIMSSLLGPGVWAYVFGLAAIRSGGIAMPLGIHVAANASQALAGMKSRDHAIWLLDFQAKPGPDALSRAENTGLLLHAAMLVIAILLTELYMRKTKKIRDSGQKK